MEEANQLKGEPDDVPDIISFFTTTSTPKRLRRQTARHDVCGNNVAVIHHRISCPSHRLIWVNWGGARLRYGSILVSLPGRLEMAGSRILVVYYSRSGTTRKIAEALTCDLEENRGGHEPVRPFRLHAVARGNHPRGHMPAHPKAPDDPHERRISGR